MKILREVAITVLIALAVFAVLRLTMQSYTVVMSSMEPNFYQGDCIMVNKVCYGSAGPQRGQVVVFNPPFESAHPFIKRVIGTEGDKIEIKNKKIFINDKQYSDNFGVYSDNVVYPSSLQPRDNFGPVVVPPNAVFVMGDNRDESADSRFWGFVDLKDVEGKALIIYWSWNSEEKEDILWKLRWNRLGNLLY